MTPAVCPYCRGSIEDADPNRTDCSGCGTPHHEDCYSENGGCTVFGCSSAPPAEPKVNVGVPELNSFAEPGTSPGAISPEGASEFPPEDGKSRTTFILLGVLLGAFGAHSFYAGYKNKGVAQLLITVLTVGFAGPMSWMWAVIDVCTITEDSIGVKFRS